MKSNGTKRWAALAMAATLALSAHAQTKMAVVDLQKVFDGYWRTKQADTQLKERANDLEKARGGMVDDYKKANEEFKKVLDSISDPSASNDEKDKRKQEAEKRRVDIAGIEQNIRTFDENSRKSILDQQKRMRDSVLRDIRGVVEEKAKSAGYQTVLDTAALSLNQTPVVVYTSLVGSADDLSDSVLKALNANAPADNGKKDEEKKPASP
ncbi:MAG: OmpH family outer membrane protein [Verrucomicrobiota bacterium]|jgi:outer membrane protein